MTKWTDQLAAVSVDTRLDLEVLGDVVGITNTGITDAKKILLNSGIK